MVTPFTPCFHIEVDGTDRTRNIWEYLESIEYEDAEGGDSDSLTFTVANDPAFAIPEPGAKIRFWLGWKEQGMMYFGAFRVDECTVQLSPATLRVTAKAADFNDAAQKSHNEKQRRDREWENVTLADIAAKIASEHGCGSHVEVDVHYPHVAQTGESNLSFLRRLAAEVGATFAVKDETILILPPERSGRPRAEIAWSDAVSGSFTAQGRESYGRVEAKWWDRKEAKEKKITSSGGGDGTPYVIKKRFHSASEAQAAADNCMAKLRQRAFEGNLTLPGDATVIAGAEVKLSGFRPDALNGAYLAKSVRHSVTASGWTTSVHLQSLKKKA